MIEEIEGFDPEVELNSFGDRETSLDGSIEVPKHWPVELVAACVAHFGRRSIAVKRNRTECSGI